MTTTESMVDRPAAPPAFQHLSGVRRTKNLIASVLVTLAFLVAVVPLTWLMTT